MVASLIRVAVVLAAACAGPTLSVQSDGPRFVDGRADARAVLPFRYYGAIDFDVLPGESGRERDWSRAPARTEVAIEPPATPWIFPLDFLVEAAARLSGPGDRSVTVTTRPAPATVVEGFPPGGLEDLRARALRARIAR